MSLSPHPSTLLFTPNPSLTSYKESAFTSVGFIILVVVASLSGILGAVYAYLYYTRINPKSSRARMFNEQSAGGEDGGGSATTHTHMLFNRKS